MAAIIAIAVTGAPSNRAAAQSAAQSNGRVGHVTVAIAKNHNERGRVKSFQSNPSVILLDRDNLTPEALATLLNAYATGHRRGAGSGRNGMVRAPQQAGHQLSMAQRKHYQKILDRLQMSTERTVPGVGRVQAIDLPVLGVP